MEKETIKPKDNTTEAPKTVTIPIEEYAKIQDNFAKMSEEIRKLQHPEDAKKIEKPKYRTVKVWFLDKEKTKMITGIGESREIQGRGDKNILETEVTYKLGDKEKKQWIDMIKLRSEGTFVLAKIKQVKEDVITKEDGHIVQTEVKDKGFNPVKTGLEVPNKVETPIHNFVLELPDGREVELGQEAIN